MLSEAITNPNLLTGMQTIGSMPSNSTLTTLYTPQKADSPTRFYTDGKNAVYDTYAQQSISKSEANQRALNMSIQKNLTPKVYPQSKQSVLIVGTKTPSKSITPQPSKVLSQLPSFQKGKSIFPK